MVVLDPNTLADLQASDSIGADRRSPAAKPARRGARHSRREPGTLARRDPRDVRWLDRRGGAAAPQALQHPPPQARGAAAGQAHVSPGRGGPAAGRVYLTLARATAHRTKLLQINNLDDSLPGAWGVPSERPCSRGSLMQRGSSREHFRRRIRHPARHRDQDRGAVSQAGPFLGLSLGRRRGDLGGPLAPAGPDRARRLAHFPRARRTPPASARRRFACGAGTLARLLGGV